METLDAILNLDKGASTKVFDKGAVLQRAGGTYSTRSFFVKRGLLRSFTIDEKGKEHIFMFASQGWIIADIESQEFNKPTALYIDALEDSEVVVFDRTCFKVESLTDVQLRENNHLLSRRVAVLQRRVIMLMSASAKQRYEAFLKTFPEIPNRVPQKMIASYLGITPEALSKIRSEYLRSK